MEEQFVNLKLISLDDIKNQDPNWPAYKNTSWELHTTLD